MPKVSIVIVTKNQKRFIEQSLPVIFGQTFKDLEVIIVDSGSTDGALEVMKKYPVKILNIRIKPFNYAKAFNLGAKQVKGDFIVRLSGDAVPANKHWLENILQGLEDKRVAGAYSRYLFSIFSDLLYQFWFRPIFSVFRGGEKTSFAGASCVIKKERWQQYPFNEKWGPGDDWEWGEVMKRIGYKILYNEDSLVYHEHRTPIWKQLGNILQWLLFGWLGGLWKMKGIKVRAQKIKYAQVYSEIR